MRFGTDFSRRDLVIGGAALAAAPAARAKAPVQEAVLPLKDFRVVRARPSDGLIGAPVLLWLPVVSGPAAPIHLDVARRLAAAGYHVLTPELPERRTRAERARDIGAVLALAAREGASRSRLGVVGYDGGERTARLALSAETRIRAGLVYPGPLSANPVTRPRLEDQPAPEARLMVHPGCPSIEAAAEAALTGGLAWLAAHGVARLS